jgi:hypothetical protein
MWLLLPVGVLALGYAMGRLFMWGLNVCLAGALTLDEAVPEQLDRRGPA